MSAFIVDVAGKKSACADLICSEISFCYPVQDARDVISLFVHLRAINSVLGTVK